MIDPHYFDELDELISGFYDTLDHVVTRDRDTRVATEAIACDGCGRHLQGIAQLVDHVEHCEP